MCMGMHDVAGWFGSFGKNQVQGKCKECMGDLLPVFFESERICNPLCMCADQVAFQKGDKTEQF